MGFFTTKKEVVLEDFCRDFYETSLLNPKIGDKEIKVNTIGGWAEVIKNLMVETDKDVIFSNIDSQKLTYELTVMSFELFALAWLRQFPNKLFSQSSFTNEYLSEQGKDSIWKDMEDYNKAIAFSATYGIDANKNYSIIMNRAKLNKQSKDNAESKGVALSDYVLESIYRPTNRQFSEKAWDTGSTLYFLFLVLCQRLGLGDGLGSGDGANNTGINNEARFRLSTLMMGIYENAKKSLDNIKIID